MPSVGKQMMSVISRFDGIDIMVYYSDHEPAQVHAGVPEEPATKLKIPDAEITRDSKGKNLRVQKLVREWFRTLVPKTDPLRTVADLVFDQWLRVRNQQPSDPVPSPDELQAMASEFDPPQKADRSKRSANARYSHYAIQSVEPLPGYKLRVKFHNSETRVADIKTMRGTNPMFDRVFREFDEVALYPGFVCWGEELEALEIEDQDLWGAGVLEQAQTTSLWKG